MAVYQEVARTLEAEIRVGLANGEFLPSEAELAERFSINRHTVRRAIDELVSAGLLLRQHGKGTMVVDSKIEYSIRSRARFSESLEDLGLKSTSRLVSSRQFTADSRMALLMGVELGTPVTQLNTLRLIEKDPVSYISHYLVAEWVPGIETLFTEGSLHSFIETKYGFQMRRKQSLIGASLPERLESSLLRCSRNLPLIVVRSNNVKVLVDSEQVTEVVIEYSVAKSRSDIFEMKIIPES